ncbi:transposase-like protein [Spirochaeta thermophila DSM 6578]|uniref:Transposase-like protein n=1 Tax=Winmispira thermophila (strain ATCC 700085 / DSM 6578 / Z-1203) TaxID=869211 RepID=G0GF26_WINT7|nr:IS1595 family transposase [Spirochaeta thermophila]AEJ62370.1 transposase-like protein [Spirochaeta thermophila DSM 6578]
MDVVSLSTLASDREKTVSYLREKGLLVTHTRCPFCGSEHIGEVRREKYKCYQCRKEWSIRRGSIFEGTKLSWEKILWAMKLFEMELTAHKAALQLRLSYEVTLRLYTLFRKAIWVHTRKEGKSLLEGEVEMDESYFGGKRKGKRGRGAAGKIPVFGILERGGKVQVEVVEQVSAEELVRLAVAKVKRGSLVYTDRFKSYDGLVSYGFRHKRIDHGKRFANGKVYINGIEGFWSYAKGRLLQHHGVSVERFPLYLKELEWRYNHREEDLFELLLDVLREYSQVADNR